MKDVIKKIKGKFTSKKLLKESKVQIDVRQPVYSKDKNRFFKSAWEEEKRQLFFS